MYICINSNKKIISSKLKWIIFFRIYLKPEQSWLLTGAVAFIKCLLRVTLWTELEGFSPFLVIWFNETDGEIFLADFSSWDAAFIKWWFILGLLIEDRWLFADEEFWVDSLFVDEFFWMLLSTLLIDFNEVGLLASMGRLDFPLSFFESKYSNKN